MTSPYLSPSPLSTSHHLDNFNCRSEEQTNWLHRHARQAVSTGTAKVFVVTQQHDNNVVAYYAWSMASIANTDAPTRLRKGAGRYPQPVALLSRLGVHQDHESRGLGAGLLQDVITRTASMSNNIGCRGLLIHAETKTARNFYQHLIPEFEPSPTDPLHLTLLLKDIKQTLKPQQEI